MCGVLGLAASFLTGASFFTFKVVGTNLVRSALKLRICGLASIIGAVGLEEAGLLGELVLACGLAPIKDGAPGRRPEKETVKLKFQTFPEI